MNFLNKKPKARLFFLIVYVYAAIWILFENCHPLLYITVSSLMLFGGYISLVKANVISDKNAINIKNFSFDFISLVLTFLLIIDLLVKAFSN